MNTFISSIITMVGLGVFFSVILAVANKHLKVEEDPRIEKIEGILPGLNCAACGFPNCRALAEAIAKNEAPPATCPAGGEEAAALIADFLGLEAEKLTKNIAVIHCGADQTQRKKKAEYTGIQTCKAANMIFWGGLECKFGCLGFGDCAKACPFDGIKMVNGLPEVDTDKCTACGKCVAACPRGIISLESFERGELTLVACNSTEKGGVVKKICPVGCTACRVCEKLSEGVFTVQDNLARVDYKKATQETNWALIVEKCPMNTIRKLETDNRQPTTDN